MPCFCTCPVHGPGTTQGRKAEGNRKTATGRQLCGPFLRSLKMLQGPVPSSGGWGTEATVQPVECPRGRSPSKRSLRRQQHCSLLDTISGGPTARPPETRRPPAPASRPSACAQVPARFGPWELLRPVQREHRGWLQALHPRGPVRLGGQLGTAS